MTEYIIYKLVCDDINIKYTYVGSTANFRMRKCAHKSCCNNEKKNQQKIYTTINENGGWNNWSMVKIETVVCDTKLDARIRERYFYEELNADLNTRYPQREQEEYRKEYLFINKEKIKEHKKEWYEINKEVIKKQNKEYDETRKEQKKEYYNINKEKFNDNGKIYYEKHKEEIKNKRSSKCKCDCGSVIRIDSKSKHLLSEKHKMLITSLSI